MFSIFSDSYPFSSIDISIIFYTIIVMCGCSQTGGHQTGMPSGRALVFLQDAIPERGCCWFPVRSAEVSSASRTLHSLESPHTTAHPSKGRGWSTKEFTGCIRVHQKFTCLMVAVHTLKRSGALHLFIVDLYGNCGTQQTRLLMA